ncbi:antitoxin MazE family protein [Mycobacterium servetii]|uniref:Antitoxin MazE family protein n=1 Tax=Mycobacterium servetii TaxID=3237418 RepID=A0ABV4CBX5_9MYCO
MVNRDVGKRVADHRNRLREQGLRPIQIWVPDTRAPGFAEEAHRQAARVATADDAAEDQAWVDDISQFNDDDFDTQ